MLSRSSLAASRGFSVNPLSPVSNAFTATARKATRAEARLVATIAVTPQSPYFMSPPPTAAVFGADGSIMERLQTVLASPFSPKTFARNILSPSPKVSVPPGDVKLKADVRGKVTSLKPRKKKAPKPLTLNEPSRTSETTPLSPLRYPGLAARPSAGLMSPPIAPTAAPAAVIANLTESEIARRKLSKLARYMGQTVPSELAFASFGQVGEDLDKVGSFLDLYRKGVSQDDSQLPDIKSPAARNSQDLMASESTKPRRRPTLRRSRSMGDFYDHAVVTNSLPYMASQAWSEEVQSVMSPTAPVEKAKEAILGSDAQRMAEFRIGFKNRPLELKLAPFPPPTGPLPSPPVPSALFALQSPRAPYWVKPAVVVPPKTPRTMRTERRQGWGGEWMSLGEMVGQLKRL